MQRNFIGYAFRSAMIACALTCASAAQATITVYNATLTGPNESPPNASPGTGTAVVTIDDVAKTMTVSVSFSGLTSPTVASHIHAATAAPGTGTAGVATMVPAFTNFPLGVTSGSMQPTLFDLLAASSYNPAYITANGGTPATAAAALISAIASGRAYFNIHTTQFPGGEIRGFLATVPEPASWMLMLLGFGAIGFALRRRQSLACA